jgi:deoxyhypusine synthase
MSFDHVLLQGCEIVDTSGMLIVPYPLCVPPNAVMYAEDVDYSDHDDHEDEEHEANESEVQPTRKRKREEGVHDKHIYYNKANNKYQVRVTKDGKLQNVGSFPTQEEAVVARDAYLRGETVINPAVKESAHGKSIYCHKASKKYQVSVTKDGKLQHVGSFPTQEEAVVARDAYLRGETVINPAVKEGAHGKYIYYHKANNKYVVQVTKDGNLHHVGSFPTQEEAVDARDAYLRGETIVKPAVKEGAHGKYIYYNKASNKYVVQFTKDGKQQHFGSFPTQEEAVVARDAYLREETVINLTGRASAFKRKRRP